MPAPQAAVPDHPKLDGCIAGDLPVSSVQEEPFRGIPVVGLLHKERKRSDVDSATWRARAASTGPGAR